MTDDLTGRAASLRREIGAERTAVVLLGESLRATAEGLDGFIERRAAELAAPARKMADGLTLNAEANARMSTRYIRLRDAADAVLEVSRSALARLDDDARHNVAPLKEALAALRDAREVPADAS